MTLYLTPYPYRHMARRMAMRQQEFTLAANLREEDDAFVLTALVPGLSADDLNIKILDDVVRIEGEYKADETDYLMRELPSGTFERTLRLPVSVDAGKAEAKITDGVLTLHLPKAETARPKQIKIVSR